MSELLLGNTNVVEHFRDPDDDSLKKVARPDLLNQVTRVTFPDGWGLAEKLQAVKNMWPWQSDADGPEWVESEDKLLEFAVAQEFTTDDHTCVTGRPENWNEGRG